MKPATKLAKAKADYLRTVWNIYQPDTITNLALRAGLERHSAAKALEAHDPELYVTVSGWNPEPYPDIIPAELKLLDLSKETAKFKLWIEALIDEPDIHWADLADKLNINLRTCYKFGRRLQDRLQAFKTD